MKGRTSTTTRAKGPAALAAAALALLVPAVPLAGGPAADAGGGLALPVHDATGVPALQDSLPSVWVVAPEGSEARYRVREQLARINFPSDAVGRTDRLEGRIVILPDGRIDRAVSAFEVHLASLESDSDRRDNFIRRNTLSTDAHPAARLVPTALEGLPSPLPGSGEASFRLAGDFTVRGVTRPTLWDVTAEFVDGAVLGRASTRFTFGDFGLEIPRVGSVLSVNDDIRLEVDFILVPEEAGSGG